MGTGSANGECRVGSNKSAWISAGIPESSFDWVSPLLRQSAAGLLKSSALPTSIPFLYPLLPCIPTVTVFLMPRVCFRILTISLISTSAFVHSRNQRRIVPLASHAAAPPNQNETTSTVPHRPLYCPSVLGHGLDRRRAESGEKHSRLMIRLSRPMMGGGKGAV